MTERFRLSSRNAAGTDGLTVTLLSTGASIAGLTLHRGGSGGGIGRGGGMDTGDRVNDRGTMDVDVVLGYHNVGDYVTDPFFMGSTIGPVANRLRDGRFTVHDEHFDLAVNEHQRSTLLHSGPLGLHRQAFVVSAPRASDQVSLSLNLGHLSDGFPGNRAITVTYTLIDARTLQLDYVATTDRPTVVNLVNHAYFNLGGPLADHELRLQASTVTPLDARLLPTGSVEPVAHSDLDFRAWRRIGTSRVDQNFVVDGDPTLRHAASLRLVSSGLQLDIITTQPALQVYTGDGLTAPFPARGGICLEAQGFPDAPNHSAFPSIGLEPQHTYQQTTQYRFTELPH